MGSFPRSSRNIKLTQDGSVKVLDSVWRRHWVG